MVKCIILIGESGTGKSLLGNYLLDANRFKYGSSPYSITTKLQKEKIDYSLSVIDMPGVYDSQNRDETNFKNALEEIKKNPDSYQISLVLIVLNFTSPRIHDRIKRMIKFISELFPKELGKHSAIVFTYYVDSLFKDERYYKKKEYVPIIMRLISEYTGEKLVENPYTFFLDSKMRDPNSNEEIARIKELAKNLSTLQKINFSAKAPSLVDHHYYPVYRERENKEEKKDEDKNKIEEHEETPGILESLYSIMDTGCKLKSAFDYADYNAKYSKGKSNYFFDMGKGASMYDDLKNGRDENYIKEKYVDKKDDDCIII